MLSVDASIINLGKYFIAKELGVVVCHYHLFESKEEAGAAFYSKRRVLSCHDCHVLINHKTFKGKTHHTRHHTSFCRC